jgi:hypothetical protein
MNLEFDKLLLQNLEGINKKLDALDNRFNNLPCSSHDLRVDRLEQKEADRKEHKATMWGLAFTAVGAFGLGIWNWLRGG